MKLTGYSRAATAIVLLAFATTGSWADRKVARSKLPHAVEKTPAEESKDATIRGLSKEVEDGKTLYEVELMVNGHQRDLLIEENGMVVEVEEEVAVSTLPAAVQDGLKKAAGAGEIVKVESLTRAGTLVAYEAVVKKGLRKTEIQIDPTGKRLDKP